jgi:hypothetical protein
MFIVDFFKLVHREICDCCCFIIPKARREGRQDKRKPAVPRTNLKCDPGLMLYSMKSDRIELTFKTNIFEPLCLYSIDCRHLISLFISFIFELL